MSSIAVRCEGLTKSFGSAPAVQEVSLELEKGHCLALLGPSGCGKTTLLRLIAGFEIPEQGSIEVGKRVVAGFGIFLPPEKRQVGMVFQDYALFPHLNVGANIAYGLAKGVDRKLRVREMLSLIGLKGFESRMPHELSGGEQQRVALARALAPEPEVLLLDEPFSNLDADLRNRIRAEVKGILACAGATAIFVTHDQDEALFMGEQVGVMNCGRIEQINTPEAIFYRPATSFVAQFVGIADFITGVVENKSIVTEIGKLPLDDGLSRGQTVRVMFRPNFINIVPASDGVGIIVERVFQGTNYLYRVQLPSGATIRSLQKHTCCYSTSTRVEIRTNLDHDVVYFADDKKANTKGAQERNEVKGP